MPLATTRTSTSVGEWRREVERLNLELS
jgi:hypothetical protein